MDLRTVSVVLVTTAALLLLSGCTANARKNWLSDMVFGMVESAVSDSDDYGVADPNEAGISKKESRRRFEQRRINQMDSDRLTEERSAQQQRDAALLKNWLHRKDMDEHFSRDRSKDLF